MNNKFYDKKIPSLKILQEELAREIEASIIYPSSFEVYKKTPQEKKELKEAKREWKVAMFASHGMAYKKFINP